MIGQIVKCQNPQGLPTRVGIHVWLYNIISLKPSAEAFKYSLQAALDNGLVYLVNLVPPRGI